MTLQTARYGTADRAILIAQFALIVMVVIWAANFSIAKEALDAVSPLAFNALRFPLAAAVVLIALRRRGPIPWPATTERWRVVLYGLLGNLVYQLLFIFGLAYSRAGTASILLAGSPIVTALLSAAVGHERLGARALIGVLATLAGIVLVVATGAQAPAGMAERPLLGAMLMIGATISWAAYTVGTRGLVDRHGSLPVTAWMLGVGAIAVVLIGLPDLVATDLGALSARTWFAVVYAGALSIGLAYLIWHHGVRRIGNTRTAVYANMVPVFALAFAWFWLHEVPRPGQLIGASVIIAGVLLTQRA